jgi:hypothetical protein
MTDETADAAHRDREDLRKHWHDFCDADPFEGGDTFAERMEARGFIRLRPVKKADLEQAFAAERGIEPGGMLWELTKIGELLMETATADGEIAVPTEVKR